MFNLILSGSSCFQTSGRGIDSLFVRTPDDGIPRSAHKKADQSMLFLARRPAEFSKAVAERSIVGQLPLLHLAHILDEFIGIRALLG